MTDAPVTILPTAEALTLDQLRQRLAVLKSAPRLAPFASELQAAIAACSESFFKHARAYPEIQALAYWLRPAALATMQKQFILPPHGCAVPQGLVFHLPPANVDTIFAYALFLSLLCGNANIVRMPSRRGAAADLLLRLIIETLAAFPEIGNKFLAITYGHDDTLTTAISASADLRMVWGGDAAVNKIRSIPLPPASRELTFPDRFSWLVLDASAYATADQTARQTLAEQAYNDIFWFDQGGCSSPRIIVWLNATDDSLKQDFYRRLAMVAKAKNWQLDVGGSIQKRIRFYAALLDHDIAAATAYGQCLTVLRLATADAAAIDRLRHNPATGGTLFELNLAGLDVLSSLLTRRDQTLTYFGLTPAQIGDFVTTSGGHTFDRIVPVGQALTFDTIWDGYDLPHHLTRIVRIGV